MSEKANTGPFEGTARELGDILIREQDGDVSTVSTDDAGGVRIKITRGKGGVEEWHVLPEPGTKFNAYNILGGKIVLQFIPE